MLEMAYNGTLFLESFDLESIRICRSAIHQFLLPLLVSAIDSWKLLLILINVCFIFYYLFWRPLYISRDFTEYGFYEANNQSGSDAGRRQIINELRRRRKLGEVLPPLYANGWFAVLDSDDVPKNKVKEISCLGNVFM